MAVIDATTLALFPGFVADYHRTGEILGISVRPFGSSHIGSRDSQIIQIKRFEIRNENFAVHIYDRQENRKSPVSDRAWRSQVMTLSAPAALSMFATILAPIETLGLSFLSWRAHPKYGITAITLSADALLAASIVKSNSKRLSVGGNVDWTIKTVAPLTLSLKEGWNSPSLNAVTSDAPRNTSGSSGFLILFISSTTLSAKSFEALHAKISILCSLFINL
jgi:hypothetical protein